MGSGSNVQSKAEVIENSYLRDSYGIERLLKSVFEIAERSRYKFDPSATTLITDLEMALDTDIFTPIERQTITLIYYAQLNYRQAAKLMEVKTHELIDATEEAIEKIAAVLMGYKTKELPAYPRVNYSPSEWLSAVGNGKAAIYHIPANINTELLHWLAANGDELAEETLRQRDEGPPVFIDERSEEAQYPCYTWNQLERMDKRLNTTYMNNEEMGRIALGRTVVGSRKVIFEDKDGVMHVKKAKIYK
jgi:predicted DNA-binding protein (UPF0251 family)